MRFFTLLSLRIAQVAPLEESVPPKLYGDTERVVSALTEELVRRGHDVTLYASGDSETSAKLVPCARQGLRLDPKVRDPLPYSFVQWMRVLEAADEFDVIHNHMGYVPLLFRDKLPTPWLTTLHGRLDAREIHEVHRLYPDTPTVAVSESQRRQLPHARWLGTVYNGIGLRHFSLRERPGTYMAFLGRLAPEQGAAEAIDIALGTGMPLKIAAKLNCDEDDYFRDRIKPSLQNRLIEHVGEIEEAQKDTFLGNAFACLFPIDWPDPFGITMVEAMACGTPVIAMNRGSVREVVDDGVTGVICRSLSEMIAAVGRISSLQRRQCRIHVERRFSAEVMSNAYEDLYWRLLLSDAGRRGSPKS